MSETPVKTLAYTSDPAVEHISWEETADGVVLTILPVPMSVASLMATVVGSIAALVFMFMSGASLAQGLPLSALFVAIAIDAPFRFRRSRKPVHIRVEGGRLKVTGAGLLRSHDWALNEIRNVRAPITGFHWSGWMRGAIEIVPAREARVSVGSGRRMEELQWAVKKLRTAMATAGWAGARHKSTSRKLGEWMGRAWRGQRADT